MRTPAKPILRGVLCPNGAPARNHKLGFSLVEALIGAGVLGFTMASLLGAFSFGFTTIKLSQEEVRADQILVQKLETLRVYDWSKVTNNNYFQTNFPAPFSTIGGTNGVTYTGRLVIAPFTPSAIPESYTNTLRQVTVSLQWVSGGVSRTRSMTTLVSQNGIQTYKP
jgi:hypothetical protein